MEMELVSGDQLITTTIPFRKLSDPFLVKKKVFLAHNRIGFRKGVTFDQKLNRSLFKSQKAA